MQRRMIVGLALLAILAFLVIGCSESDGMASASIGYQSATEVKYIVIDDGTSVNGIYGDRDAGQFYCGDGPDSIIELPGQVSWEVNNSRDVVLEAEAVCDMGQEAFDEFLKLFTLVTTP